MTPEEFVEAIEHVTRVTLLNVEPGATVVLEAEEPITAEQAARIREMAERLFSPHKVAILAGGLRITGARVETEGGG